jgi:hypothetical protein
MEKIEIQLATKSGHDSKLYKIITQKLKLEKI